MTTLVEKSFVPPLLEKFGYGAIMLAQRKINRLNLGIGQQ